MNFKIMTGDNRDTLKTLKDNSIDAIVTDPPYGIDFLGKAWDANTGALATYQECLRVLKPGGHILAFSAARTYHHLAITLEQAGFEIRDQLMWLYSSGFPKSQDVGKAIDKRAGKKDPNYTGMTKSPNKIKGGLNDTGTNAFGAGVYCPKCEKTLNADIVKQCKEVVCAQVYRHQTDDGKTWAGWGTALKPAHEPIALARKPFKGSTIDNVLTHGVGALNINATRVETDDKIQNHYNRNSGAPEYYGEEKNIVDVELTYSNQGRFPSNVLGEILQDDYQKYFYCPKVSRKERHIGFDDVPDPLANYAQGDVKNHPLWDPSIGTNVQRLKHKILEHNKTLGQAHQVQGSVGNNHPTVKPIELMKYLIKLITPPGGVVLDPFNGSGSTGMAAVELGFEYIGCELDPAYVAIAEKRIRAWNTPEPSGTTYEELFE